MLKAIVENIDAVDEQFRGLYTEKDGIHILNVEPVNGFALEDVTGLKTALNSERDARKTADISLKAFEGIDPAAARTALANADRFKDFDPEKDAERIAGEKFELAKSQLMAEFEGKLSPITQENEQLRSHVLSTAVNSDASQAIAEAAGNAVLLMPVIKSQTRAEYKDGKVVISVLDAEGKPRVKDHVNGTLFGISDLVAELKANEAYGGAFQAGGGGSGSNPNKHGPSENSKADIGGNINQRKAALEALIPGLKSR